MLNTSKPLSSALVIISFILVGCQTAPFQFSTQDEGQWQAKAVVKNHVTKQSGVVSIDINAKKQKQIRLDITAVLGQPVASLVLNSDQLTYVLIDQKQYYQGPSEPQALKAILPVSIHPDILYSIVFETPITDKSWVCDRDRMGILKTCQQASTGTRIVWSDRKGIRKTVKIENQVGVVQLQFQSFQPKVEQRDNLFVLTPPKSFKSIR